MLLRQSIAVKKRSGTGRMRRWWLKKKGGEKPTITLCQAVLQRADGARRQAEVEFVAPESSRGKESKHIVGECGNLWEMSNFQVKCGSIFTLKRAEAKKILEDAAREKQEGTQGQWQQEAPSREILEQVSRKCGYGMRRPNECGKSSTAIRGGSWEEFKEGCREKREFIRMDPRENTRSS